MSHGRRKGHAQGLNVCSKMAYNWVFEYLIDSLCAFWIIWNQYEKYSVYNFNQLVQDIFIIWFVVVTDWFHFRVVWWFLGTLTTAILKDFRVVIFACAIMDMSWVLCGLSRAPDFSSDYLNLLGNHFMNNDHDVTGSIQILHINIRLKSDCRFRIRRLFS